MQKLAPSYNAIAMPLVLSMLMTIVVSCISTLNAVGWQPGWANLWLKGWLLSWAVAFPVMVFVLPVARRLVGRFVEPPPLPVKSAPAK